MLAIDISDNKALKILIWALQLDVANFLILSTSFFNMTFSFSLTFFIFSNALFLASIAFFIQAFIVALVLLKSRSQAFRIAIIQEFFANMWSSRSFSFLEVQTAASINFFLALIDRLRKSINELLFCIKKRISSAY